MDLRPVTYSDFLFDGDNGYTMNREHLLGDPGIMASRHDVRVVNGDLFWTFPDPTDKDN